MYYDVNISSRYVEQDVGELEESEYRGFCVNTVVRGGEFKRYVQSGPSLCVRKSVYSRVEVEFGEGDQVSYESKRAMSSDLFVVKLNDVRMLDKVIKLGADMVTFDYTSQPIAFKAGLIRTAIKERMFLEIPLRGGLYGGAGAVMWMRNVRRLLGITNGRNVVISSGATCSTEVRRPGEIGRMLEVFGIKRKRTEVVLRNPERLLRSCAIRRYSHKNTVVHSGDEGALKRDFILCSYRGAKR